MNFSGNDEGTDANSGASGDGLQAQRRDSLQAMRSNFFGTPLEAGADLLPPTIVRADDTHHTTPPRVDDSNDNNSSDTNVEGTVGMSAAKKYFTREDAEDATADANDDGSHTVSITHAHLDRDNDGRTQQQQQQHRHRDEEDDYSDAEQGSRPTITAVDHANTAMSELAVAHKAEEEEQVILEARKLPRTLTADEEQAARMRAYDAVCGTSTWDFLRETAQAVVPDAVNTMVDTGAEALTRGSESIIPDGVRRAADAFGSAATTASHAIEAVPKMMVSVIPNAMMSQETKQMLFGDFTNTLRSFYHTNVLSMPYVLNQAGLIGGILLLLVVSFTSEYATEAFFGAKNQLRDARKVVTYGDVPRLTWGTWYPSLNLFYGITHLIGFIAFSASNTRVLLAAMGLTGGGAMAVSLIVPSMISLPLVFIKRDVDQKPYAIISSFIVFVSVICMFTYFPYNATTDIKLWANSASDYFVALGVAVYAFTGIGSCAPIERTMKPRRYVKCLRAAVTFSCAVLLTFGLSGFLSYGPNTCSVITVSLQPGPMKTAVSALLFVASVAIIPQQTFPFCELCDRRLLGIRHVPTYWELKPNLLRIGALVVSALAAWIVPYYGLLLSMSGALGCGTVGIIVPAAMDYMRRARWGLREGRHLLWWEYLIVFGLGMYGCAVVIIGVTFGMYKLWITIQTNSAGTC